MRLLAALSLAVLPTTFALPGLLNTVSQQILGGGDGPVKAMNSWSFVDCGMPTDVVQIKSLTVSPDPPEPGKNLTVTAVGYVTETIQEGAYADVVVKLGLVKLLSKRFDICEEARNNDISLKCPVEPGDHTVQHTVLLPKEIPKAKFLVQVRAFTVEDDDLMCADLRVDFLPKRPF